MYYDNNDRDCRYMAMVTIVISIMVTMTATIIRVLKYDPNIQNIQISLLVIGMTFILLTMVIVTELGW